MDEYSFRYLKNYMAADQRVKLDTAFFSPRQKTGIANGLRQGFWLSAGKIAWLIDALAEEYKLPFIKYKKGRYGSLSWNQHAKSLPGLLEAVTALIAYDKMVGQDLKSNYYAKNQVAQQQGVLRFGIESQKYVSLVNPASDQVKAQLAKLNVVEDERITKFLEDFKNNNIWITVT